MLKKKTLPAHLLLGSLAAATLVSEPGAVLAAPPRPRSSPSPVVTTNTPVLTSIPRNGTTVQALKIKSLQSFRGNTLNVFYVSGREAAFGLSGQTLKTRAIKHGPVRVPISDSGEANIPSVVINNSGFQAFNYLVFAITPPNQAEVYLRNTDGTFPEDPRNPPYPSLRDSDFQNLRQGFISTLRLREMNDERTAAGRVSALNELLEIDAATDF